MVAWRAFPAMAAGKISLAVLAATIASSPAHAKPHNLTAENIVEFCADGDDSFAGMFCIGYLQGVQAALVLKGGMQCPQMTGSELMAAANVAFRNYGKRMLETATHMDNPPLAMATSALFAAGCTAPRQPSLDHVGQ
jgi:hypothetical protein